MNLIDLAYQTAAEAHWGQKDKGGKDYICHPVRVALMMKEEAEQVVALLHDVVEDTEITLDSLRKVGFPDPIVCAVDCMTKRKDLLIKVKSPKQIFLGSPKRHSKADRCAQEKTAASQKWKSLGLRGYSECPGSCSPWRSRYVGTC